MTRVFWLATVGAMVGLSALAAAFGLNGWPPSTAQAGPLADCNSQPWKAAVPGLVEGLPGFKCKTLQSGPASGVNVRVVADEALGNPLVAEMAPQIMQAAQKALPKYKGYRPSLLLRNVTFIIVSAPDRTDEAVANPALGEECVVFVFITKKLEARSVADRALGTPFTAAHELVHCTQYWNFKPQMLVDFDDRSWWSEATADYLASTVIDDQKGIKEQADNFVYKSAETPLTSLGYDAYTFFAWLGGVKGPANAYAFMAAMPAGGGIKAQRAALLSQAGGPAGMQDFATAFVDGTIKAPAGWALPRPDLTVVTISGSTDKSLTADSFTLMRGALKFAKGEYELSAKTAPAPEARWSDADGAWGPAPKTIGKTCEGEAAGLRYALFATGEGKATVTLKVKKAGEGQDGEDDKCKKSPPPVSSCSPLPQKDSMSGRKLDRRRRQDDRHARQGPARHERLRRQGRQRLGR